MSRGINKVILVGNLCADPELRNTSTGAAVATLRVATSDSWRDKQTGEMQERTEFHRVKFFGRLAEVSADWLRKGRQVYIEGSLRTDKYTDSAGTERYSTDVIGNEMQMLGSAGSKPTRTTPPSHAGQAAEQLPADGSDFGETLY